jgi:hypothetical protein
MDAGDIFRYKRPQCGILTFLEGFFLAFPHDDGQNFTASQDTGRNGPA